MKYQWVIFGIVVMGAITGTLILTPSLVKAQSISTGTYETDSKLQVICQPSIAIIVVHSSGLTC